MVFSVWTADVYTMTFHFRNHLLEDMRTFGDVLVLDATIYNHFNVHMKTAYRKSFQRQVCCT